MEDIRMDSFDENVDLGDLENMVHSDDESTEFEATPEIAEVEPEKEELPAQEYKDSQNNEGYLRKLSQCFATGFEPNPNALDSSKFAALKAKQDEELAKLRKYQEENKDVLRIELPI